ncbi:MAG: hypothetical protein ACI4LL_07255, partial [Anaerovoracaceae bacterium]
GGTSCPAAACDYNFTHKKHLPILFYAWRVLLMLILKLIVMVMSVNLCINISPALQSRILLPQERQISKSLFDKKSIYFLLL